MPPFAQPREIALHDSHVRGKPATRPIAIASSPGTDLRVWDALRGRRDDAIPELETDLADLIRGAAFQCLEEFGHLLCIEAPGPLARLVPEFHGVLP